MVMTKPPSDSRNHNPTNPPRGIARSDVHVGIRLTASAERYARRNALVTVLEEANPGPSAAVDDILSLMVDGVVHDFAVAQRRWIFDGGVLQLELTVDHPAFGRR
jgi:hypothetical protein